MRGFPHFTISPHFVDSDPNVRSRTAFIMMGIATGINLLCVAGSVVSPQLWPMARTYLLANLTAVASVALIRRGRVTVGITAYLLSTWIATAVTAGIYYPGLANLAVSLHLLIILTAGLLVDPRCGYLFAFLTLLNMGGMYAGGLQERSLLPLLVFQFSGIVMTVVMVRITWNVLQNAFRRSAENEAHLAEKNRELEEIRQNLEIRIADRTAEILRQKGFYETLVNNSPVAIVTLDRDHRIISSNPAFQALFGYTAEESCGRLIDDLVTDPATRPAAEAITRQVKAGLNIHSNGRRKRKDGSTLDLEIFGVSVQLDDQQVGVLALYNDITERVRVTEALRQQHDFITTAIESLTHPFFVVNARDYTIALANSATGVTGRSPALPCYTLAHQLRFPCESKGGRCALQEVVRTRQPVVVEHDFYGPDDQMRTFEVHGYPVFDAAGQVAQMIEYSLDITERKKAESYLQHLATHDALTKLPNRVLFYERLEYALAGARRTRSNVLVMFLDLDGFKQVNDLLGHEQGDRLLKEVAARLRETLRETDMVARLGGDEFVFVVENLASASDATAVADRVLTALSETGRGLEHKLRVTGSLGLSLSPQDGEDAETLLKHADAAMYRAKDRGKNTYEFYSNPAAIPLPISLLK